MPLTINGQNPIEEPNDVSAELVVPTIKYGADNPHPAQGTYCVLPIGEVNLVAKMYLGIAKTGGMGITNIKFEIKDVDAGDGVSRNWTVHAGWANITVSRTQEELIKLGRNPAESKASGLRVEELEGFTINEDGTTNIDAILGPKHSRG